MFMAGNIDIIYNQLDNNLNSNTASVISSNDSLSSLKIDPGSLI